MASLGDRFKEQWGGLAEDFLERIAKPSSRPTAGLYLFLAVAAFGGFGLWVTIFMARFGQARPRDLALGIATYAVAIVATSVGDLMLDREASPALRFLLFAIATSAAIGCAALTYFHVFAVKEGETVSVSAVLMCVAPVWATWWLVNGVDQRFLMTAAPKAALGGDAGGKW